MIIKELDNPVWSALTSGNYALSIGNDKAKRFQVGISPFVAVAQHDLKHYIALKELVSGKESVAIFTTDKIWTLIHGTLLAGLMVAR